MLIKQNISILTIQSSGRPDVWNLILFVHLIPNSIKDVIVRKMISYHNVFISFQMWWPTDALYIIVSEEPSHQQNETNFSHDFYNRRQQQKEYK